MANATKIARDINRARARSMSLTGTAAMPAEEINAMIAAYHAESADLAQSLISPDLYLIPSWCFAPITAEQKKALETARANETDASKRSAPIPSYLPAVTLHKTWAYGELLRLKSTPTRTLDSAGYYQIDYSGLASVPALVAAVLQGATVAAESMAYALYGKVRKPKKGEYLTDDGFNALAHQVAADTETVHASPVIARVVELLTLRARVSAKMGKAKAEKIADLQAEYNTLTGQIGGAYSVLRAAMASVPAKGDKAGDTPPAPVKVVAPVVAPAAD